VLLRRGLFNPDTRLGRAIREIHSPFDAIERTSAAIARGNLRVFEEIGAEFAKYLAQCSADDPDGARLAAFLQGLRPGDPPDGQGYLQRAFTHMHEMRLSRDPIARAELMALATVEIGFHEQTRLQAEILDALNSPLATTRDLKRRTAAALLPGAGAWRQLLERGPIGAALVRAVAAVRRFADRVTREAITECVMVLSLPDGTPVRLGGPLDIPIPDVLRSGQHADLRELVARLERCSPGLPSMGASDWSVFEERMHVILHVFCGYSDRADLFTPPFSEEQVRTIVAGRVPDGRL
jgi:hypothetical protein